MTRGRAAQEHPERYENLQVRVCGWNIRWNDLPREQQDAYIRRAETKYLALGMPDTMPRKQ